MTSRRRRLINLFFHRKAIRAYTLLSLIVGVAALVKILQITKEYTTYDEWINSRQFSRPSWHESVIKEKITSTDKSIKAKNNSSAVSIIVTNHIYENVQASAPTKRTTNTLWTTTKFTVNKPVTTIPMEWVHQRQERTMLMKFQGRLGNNLFQYASCMGLGILTNRVALTSGGGDLERAFPNLNLRTTVPNTYSRIYKSAPGLFFTYFEPEKMNLIYDTNLVERLKSSNATGVELTGFFQSFKYFHHIRNRIKQEFRFSQTHIRKADELISSVRGKSPGTKVIGIHIRRGDMANVKHFINFGYYAANEDYITRAMSFFAIEKYPGKNLRFIAVSNDLNWSNASIDMTRYNVYLVQGSSPYADLCLVSRCDDVIMTVGTFGWWAGYLSNGAVVYQEKFARPNTTYGNLARKPEDFFPPEWIPL